VSACSMSNLAERASVVACSKSHAAEWSLCAHCPVLQARMQRHLRLRNPPRRPLATKGMQAAERPLLAALVLPPLSAHPHRCQQPMTRRPAARTG
jgi:hypothetical protein